MSKHRWLLVLGIVFLILILSGSSATFAATPFHSPRGNWLAHVSFYAGLQKGQHAITHLTFLSDGRVTATTDGLSGVANGDWAVLDLDQSEIFYEFSEPLGKGQFVHVVQRGFVQGETMHTQGWGVVEHNGLPLMLPHQTSPDATSLSQSVARRIPERKGCPPDAVQLSS